MHLLSFVLFTTSLYAFAQADYTPNLNDSLTYDVVEIKKGKVKPIGQQQIYLKKHFANMFLVYEDFIRDTSGKPVNEFLFPSHSLWLSQMDIYRRTITDINQFCEKFKGTLEDVTVPAGNFETCKIVDENNRAVWYIAHQPLVNYVKIEERSPLFPSKKTIRSLASSSFGGNSISNQIGSHNNSFNAQHWSGEAQRYDCEGRVIKACDLAYAGIKIKDNKLEFYQAVSCSPGPNFTTRLKLDIEGQTLYRKGEKFGTISSNRIYITGLKNPSKYGKFYEFKLNEDGFLHLNITSESGKLCYKMWYDRTEY